MRRRLEPLSVGVRWRRQAARRPPTVVPHPGPGTWVRLGQGDPGSAAPSGGIVSAGTLRGRL